MGGVVGDTATARRSDWLSRPLKRWTDANVTYATSFADAIRKGYAKFGDSVTEENVGRLDISNGLLRGAIAGWTATMEELPKVVAGFYDTLVRETPAGPRAVIERPPKRKARRAKASRRSARSRK
jgi:hypothetical protein